MKKYTWLQRGTLPQEMSSCKQLHCQHLALEVTLYYCTVSYCDSSLFCPVVLLLQARLPLHKSKLNKKKVAKNTESAKTSLQDAISNMVTELIRQYNQIWWLYYWMVYDAVRTLQIKKTPARRHYNCMSSSKH